MKFIRNWLWLLPALGAGIPGTLAAVSLFQGDFGAALNRGLAALVLLAVFTFATATFSGALKAWAEWLGDSLVAMFNFRAGGLAHHMWQVPVGLTALLGLFAGFKLHFNTATIIHVYILIGAVSFLALYAALYLLHTKWAKPAFVGAGLVVLTLGLYLWSYRSNQIELYNAGIAAMDQGDIPTAVKLFDASVAAYKHESSRSQLARLILPEPNKDLEARALFHKGNCLVKARKTKDAVKAYIESLQSNPGNCFEGITLEQAASRYNDALQTMANLEKLFSAGQSGGKATGNGKQRGQGQPQPGPSRDRQPNPGAGRQPRDTL
jgi:tetratricopeptide (TPR) repeat protein